MPLLLKPHQVEGVHPLRLGFDSRLRKTSESEAGVEQEAHASDISRTAKLGKNKRATLGAFRAVGAVVRDGGSAC